MPRRKADPIDAVIEGFLALDANQRAIALGIIKRSVPTTEQVAAVVRQPRKPKAQPQETSA